MNNIKAEQWHISDWFNTDKPITLESLKGKVVAIHAFQMLCPGCVSHGLPQATKMHQLFKDKGLAVIGLHSVFEHHETMNKTALNAFIHEYKLSFPIGIDAASIQGPIPQTMELYNMSGTPSVVLIDKSGFIRLHHFGRLDDMFIGEQIGKLLGETSNNNSVMINNQGLDITCDENGCSI